MNEDVFRLASGGIVSKRILSWLGERGREAVVPLEGTAGRKAMSAFGGGATTNHFHANINVAGSATEDVLEQLVSQLRQNFERMINDAHFEHSRSALT